MQRLNQISIHNEAKTQSAEINIDGTIGVPEWWQFDNDEDKTSTYDKFASILKNIKSIDAKNILVNIRSLGGSVEDALLIHDALISLNATITTRCFGYTASAATLISQAASEGNREMSANSLYLIHKASSAVWGNANDMKAQVDMLEKTDNLIANLYASRSGKDVDDFKKLMNEDNGNGKWLTPAEAVEAGLIDKISEKQSDIYNISDNEYKTFGLPNVPENKRIFNQNKKINMKIKNTFTAILNFLGVTAGEKETETEITDDQLAKVNAGLAEKDSTIADLTTKVTGKDTEIENLKKEISDKENAIKTLKEKVGNLESDLAKAKAVKTETEDVEDPEIGDKKQLSENEKAAQAEVDAIKN